MGLGCIILTIMFEELDNIVICYPAFQKSCLHMVTITLYIQSKQQEANEKMK